VRYAEFHQRLLNQDLQDAAWDLVTIFQEEIAPKSWWGVLLCDAVQLLQYGKSLLSVRHMRQLGANLTRSRTYSALFLRQRLHFTLSSR
jgi:hypothetical protein